MNLNLDLTCLLQFKSVIQSADLIAAFEVIIGLYVYVQKFLRVSRPVCLTFYELAVINVNIAMYQLPPLKAVRNVRLDRQ